MYKIVFTKKAVKDVTKLKECNLDKKAKQLIEILREESFKQPPRFEKLLGELSGAYSRRINIKHRLVYQVVEEEKIVKTLSMWSHYEF